LDAAVDIKNLVKKAKELSMPALAITDHGSMHGAIEFYNAAKKQGIKPIIGCEFYVAPEKRSDRTKIGGESAYHLICLAKNQIGYENLLKLCSTAYIDGFYYRPRIDKEVLKECSSGLIASSACLQGDIPKAILSGDFKKAGYLISEYKELFGDDNFFLELMDHGIEEQRIVNKGLITLSKETDTPLIATNDVHYISRDDYEAHDAYLCIGTGKKLNDENRLRYTGSDFYLKSGDEMGSVFESIPDALRNTLYVADKISFNMDDKYGGGYHLPKFEVPDKKNEDDFLTTLCYKGLEEKYEEITSELKQRLDFELGVIKKMKFPAYFLIVQDIINWAKSNGISVGPGRGSAAGSLVAYTLGITNIDPLRYGLIFERFLNPDRVSMPDIDTDFEDENRDKVIEYIREKYGDDKVAQIITFGSLKARMVIRDVCRVMDIPLADTDKIAKLIPSGPDVTLDKAYKETQELQTEINSSSLYKKMFEIAKRLEGLRRNPGIHAAGVIISDEELTKYVPLYKDPKRGTIATQYEGSLLEDCGLLKMDILGLKNLSVIKRCVKLIKETKNIDIDTDKLVYDDADTYRLLQEAKSIGVFQLESEGIRELLSNLKPDNFEEIIALIALYRPGPLNSGMDKTFIRRKFKLEKVLYPHEDLIPILKSTYGVFIYQEQVMEIAKVIGGFSMAKADALRKAMGKKQADKMAELRELFVKGAAEQKYNKKMAEDLYDAMAEFAQYGFNKSHSAAYAVITYTTAYLKTHYSVEYMSALLTVYKNDIDDVAKYIREAKSIGVEVLAPDVNRSCHDFSVEEGKIRFGLSAIQNVGGNAAASIVEEREKNGDYKNFFDFVDRVDTFACNKKVLEALTKSGGFDCFKSSRSAMFYTIEDALASSTSQKQLRAAGQMTLFGAGGNSEDTAVTIEDDRSLADVEEWHESEILKNEKELLGVYLTSHPLIKWEDHVKRLSSHNTMQIKEAKDAEKVAVAGMVSDLSKRKAKSGARYAIIQIEDFEGHVEGILFRDALEACENILQKGAPVLAEGTVRVDSNGRVNVNFTSIKHLTLIRLPKIKNFINIYLNDEEIKEDRLHSLKEILSSHRGKTCVNFIMHDENNNPFTVRVSDDFNVSVSNDLKRRLTEHSCVRDFYESEIVER
jgi:DNA polymerase-3 subunit alpha